MESQRLRADPAPTIISHSCTADGLKLAHECWDADAGPDLPPILYLHGFGQTRQAWRSTAQRLRAAGFSGTAVDGRGHGESGWNPPAQRYAMQQFVDDALEVTGELRARHSQPPILVGASMGGLLGLLTEGESECGRYSALVMVDVTPRWESQSVERILRFMGAHPEGFDSLDAAADAIAGYLPHRRRKSVQELSSLLVRREDGRWRWHWDPRLLDEVAHDVQRHQARLMLAASRVRIPTLLVSGGRSDIVSEATVNEFLALVPHARHVRIAEATHMVAGDRNDAFTDAILEFLTTMRPRITSFRGADA